MKTTIIVLALCFTQALCFKDYVLRDLGCWKDTGRRAIPSIDSRLQGAYKSRPNAIQQCAHVAAILGYKVFAVQDGGWCASGPNAMNTYTKYGASTNCASDGKGGSWANQVYEIDAVLKVNYRPVGCFKDTGSRAIPTIEKRFVDLHENYRSRADALRKCARSAAALGNTVFALQHGGWCASSSTAHQTYDKYGPSQDCGSDGEGGSWANNVYEITDVTKITLDRLGCYLDKSERAMPFLEQKEVFDVDEYQKRPYAIEECVRYAAGFPHVHIGIQNGGSCMAGPNYRKYGHSTACQDHSKGESWANEVFKLSFTKLEIPAPKLPMHKLYYLNNLGCWKDTSNRAIPGLEKTTTILIGEYKDRKDAIQKCAQAAVARGFNVIGVQNGGACFSGVNARGTYAKYGVSDKCGSDGEGGPWANQVYEINVVYNPVFTGLGCYKDTSARAITPIDGTQPAISGNYQDRSDAVRKCARAAAALGFKVFGVQNGGYCSSSANAASQYMKFGLANNCGSGRGGSWSNSVYEILDEVDFYIEDRGCWADDAFRTIPPVETENPEFVYHPEYKTREDALAKCARFAHSRGFKFFALQNGGWCATSADAGDNYTRIGPSNRCGSDGEGGSYANQVYEIVPQVLA